jgi:UDP-glucose 4-epimerase
MALLVTGGAGYIGSHCAGKLLALGREVIVLDDLSTSSGNHVPAGTLFIQGSVGDQSLVAELVRTHNISTVLHFAAFVKVEESVREPAKYLENNYRNTQRLIESARAAGVEHFVFSSTAAVYGVPYTNLVDEHVVPAPVNPYGESKLLAEAAVREAFGSHTILRYFNVAGADPLGRYGYTVEDNPSHLIRMALAVVRGVQPFLPVFGTDYPTQDGTGVRDYIHVADLVDAHVDALRHLEKGGSSGTYNCGYGHGYSVLEVCDAVERVTGKPLAREYVNRRPGDPPEVVADSTRIRTELGWTPRLDSIEVMIDHQYRWELSQKRE